MLDIEQQQIQDRAKRYQSQAYEAPQGRMVGRHYVAPNILQHIAAGLRGYGSIQGMNQSEQELKDLQTKRQETESRDMSAFVDLLRPKPARDAVTLPDDQAGPVMNAQAATPGDPFGAYSLAAGSTIPNIRTMGMTGLAKMPELEAQKQERIDNRAFRAQESELARQARAQELQARMEDQRASQAERLAAQKELRQMQIDNQRQMQQMIQANRPERQAQIIDTDQGKMRVLPNGTLAPLVDAQGNALSGPKGPTGTAAQQRDADSALNAIAQAEKILPNATSSGFGNAVDATGAFFGVSTTGAQNAAKLKAIEGDLVSKMPKMSGPQSDKDVLLYRQMAGVVGDATQPVETRQAALQAVKEIQQRYSSPRVKLGPQGNPNSVMTNSGGGNIDSLLDKYK